MTSPVGVDSILQQIRTLRQQTQQPLQAPGAAPAPGAVQAPAATGFENLLKQSVESVNGLQQQSDKLKSAYERGDSEVSLTQVMVSLQKADVSFRSVVEVRNKMIDAYNEVMRMSV